MNELIKYENSLWGKFKRKIINFFRIFKHKEKIAEDKQSTKNELQKTAFNTTNNLSEKLKNEIDVAENKQILLESINENMNVVENFSTERLKQVSQLFDEACEIKIRKINELKRRIQTIQNSEP